MKFSIHSLFLATLMLKPLVVFAEDDLCCDSRLPDVACGAGTENPARRDSCNTYEELASKGQALGLYWLTAEFVQTSCGGGTVVFDTEQPIPTPSGIVMVPAIDYITFLEMMTFGSNYPNIPIVSTAICSSDDFSPEDPWCCFNEASGDCRRRDAVASCVDIPRLLIPAVRKYTGISYTVQQMEDFCSTGNAASFDDLLGTVLDPEYIEGGNYDPQNGIVCSREQVNDPTLFGFSGGDPHFSLWNGTWYDFHGECDLVMLRTTFKSTPLAIHIRTTMRYDYSFIESAAVQLGDDVLEVSSWGGNILNGVGQVVVLANADDVPTISGYPIHYQKASEKEHSFEIRLSKDQSITIRSFKDMVSVKLDVRSSDLQKSQGLLGQLGTGKMLARDGGTILDDPLAFGQEWQVLSTEPKLFQQAKRSPQSPQACKLPSPLTKDTRRRRLGETVAKHAAEAACAHWNAHQRAMCVNDVMATGDIELAKAGHY